MAKIMPVAIQDKTSDFILQMAQGNQALARLYTQLLARYEERMMQQDFQREMFDKQSAEKRSYWDYTQGPQTGDADTPHPFGSRGAQPNAVPPPTAPAAQQRPVARPMPMMPGATPIPGQDSFAPGGGTPTPASPVSGQVPTTPGYDSFAQAPRLTEEFSSQQRIGGQPQAPARQPRPASRMAPPPGQLPRGTGMDPPTKRTRKPPAQAEFLPIGQEWLDKMSEAEKKYNVPQGSLLALYGFENAGGRVLGKNSRSSAAGIFQFTEGLMKDYKVDPSQRNNPDVMIDLAARNLRRNANVLERDYKIKLEPNSQNMPLFTIMHQLGVTDGPLVVRQLMANPDVPMVQVMAAINGRNNAKVLADNGIPSNYTVRQVFSQHAGLVQPWYDKGLTLSGTATTAPATTTQPPRPPADVPDAGPARVENVGPLSAIRKGPVQYPVKPQVQTLIDEFQQRYPSARITSTYRSPEHNRAVGGASGSQHIQRTAFDFSLGNMPDAQKAEAINFLRSRGAVGLGNYGGNSFHADLRTGSPNVAWGPNRSNTSLGATPRWFQQIAQDHLGGRAPPAVVARAAPPVATAQQPMPQQASMRMPKPSEMTDVTGRFGVAPSPDALAGGDIRSISMFGDPSQAPPIQRLTPQAGGPPITPRANELSGGLAARSDPNFIASGPPIAAGPSGVAARSNLDYNVVPPTQREAPIVGPYEGAPEAPMPNVEAPLMEQPQPQPTPDPMLMEQPQPMPDIAVGDAIPQPSTPFDWPTDGMPQSPDITGPAISLQGGPPNAPPPQEFYPPPAFPQVAETSHNYDPNSRAGRRIDYNRRQQAEASPDARMNIYDRLVRGVGDTANIVPQVPQAAPSGDVTAASAQPVAPPSAPIKPTTIQDITKAIYGSDIIRPRMGGGRGAAEVEYARNARQAQLPTPSPQSSDNQAAFNAAMQDFVKRQLGGEPIDVARGSMERMFKAAPGAMEQIMEMVKRYSSGSVPEIKRKTQDYGADWMPKAPVPAAGAKPVKPGDEDTPPPLANPPKVVPKPSSAQPATVMPSMAPKTMPAAPGGSAGGGSAAARKAAAAAQVQAGENYSFVDDAGVTQYEIKE